MLDLLERGQKLPPHYDGDVLLIRAMLQDEATQEETLRDGIQKDKARMKKISPEEFRKRTDRSEAQWKEIDPQLQVYPIQATHYTMAEAEHVEEIMDAIVHML